MLFVPLHGLHLTHGLGSRRLGAPGAHHPSILKDYCLAFQRLVANWALLGPLDQCVALPERLQLPLLELGLRLDYLLDDQRVCFLQLLLTEYDSEIYLKIFDRELALLYLREQLQDIIRRHFIASAREECKSCIFQDVGLIFQIHLQQN